MLIVLNNANACTALLCIYRTTVLLVGLGEHVEAHNLYAPVRVLRCLYYVPTHDCVVS